ncbi:MAG: hypothetical protein V3U67_00455 [Gemmatimonadota bacterium]
MAWAAIVLVLVLMIPILAIVLDSEIGGAFARRISRGSSEDARLLTGRIEELETEVRYLSETLGSLQDETRFVRSLIEKPKEEPEAELGPVD